MTYLGQKESIQDKTEQRMTKSIVMDTIMDFTDGKEGREKEQQCANKRAEMDPFLFTERENLLMELK